MSTTGVSWDMHILYLFYTTWLHIWVKEYKSVHPLGVDPAHPTCTSTWSAAGPADIPQKLKNILQNSGIDQSFPVHHQWCSQENSWNECSKIFLEELIKNPYRDNLSTSMISILLADTFGDYWQRYWFHFDGWGQKLYSNSINNNHPGLNPHEKYGGVTKSTMLQGKWTLKGRVSGLKPDNVENSIKSKHIHLYVI